MVKGRICASHGAKAGVNFGFETVACACGDEGCCGRLTHRDSSTLCSRACIYVAQRLAELGIQSDFLCWEIIYEDAMGRSDCGGLLGSAWRYAPFIVEGLELSVDCVHRIINGDAAVGQPNKRRCRSEER